MAAPRRAVNFTEPVMDPKVQYYGTNASITMAALDCRYGRMLAFSTDNVIGRSLRLYGEWAEHELSLLRSFIVEGTTIIDVGANIGTHTLPLSRWVQNGRVIAIEAQPVVSFVLRDNCLQNGCLNVQIVNAICGAESGSIEFRIDYRKEQNLGAISFARGRGNRWRGLFYWLNRLRGLNTVNVPIITLDELCRDELVALIKIDIEGMELDALRGAGKLLARCHPVIYFEQNNTTRLSDTYDYLSGTGYRMFWLETHPFNQNNFRGVTENIWWRTETGIIAVPKHIQHPTGLIEVKRNDQSPPNRLDARAGIAVSA
jgi:FkbM family methyltransferase